MIKRHIGKIIFIILSFVIILFVINLKIFEKKDSTLIKPKEFENEIYSSNIIKDVEEIDGYSMIINKNFFTNNIFFDEKFFMYLENVDLCLRAKKKVENYLLLRILKFII